MKRPLNWEAFLGFPPIVIKWFFYIIKACYPGVSNRARTRTVYIILLRYIFSRQLRVCCWIYICSYCVSKLLFTYKQSLDAVNLLFSVLYTPISWRGEGFLSVKINGISFCGCFARKSFDLLLSHLRPVKKKRLLLNISWPWDLLFTQHSQKKVCLLVKVGSIKGLENMGEPVLD